MAVADSGGRGGHGPPGPVKIGHKKDGRQRRPHRFHVSRSPPYPAAGSATEMDVKTIRFAMKIAFTLPENSPLKWVYPFLMLPLAFRIRSM